MNQHDAFADHPPQRTVRNSRRGALRSPLLKALLGRQLAGPTQNMMRVIAKGGTVDGLEKVDTKLPAPKAKVPKTKVPKTKTPKTKAPKAKKKIGPSTVPLVTVEEVY